MIYLGAVDFGWTPAQTLSLTPGEWAELQRQVRIERGEPEDGEADEAGLRRFLRELSRAEAD